MTSTASPVAPPRPVGAVVAFLPAAFAAAVAVLVSLVFPLAGPLLVALVIGAIAANTRVAELGVMSDQGRTTRLLLRLGVVMLGLKLPVQDIVGIGVGGIVIVATTVSVTYLVTIRVGDLLGLDRGFVTLLAAGFSICGAAAIVAVDEAVHAKQKFVALAVGMVTLFGSAMILIVPWLSGVVGLSDRQAAIWAGSSIHEVAQVVAAASVIGGGALAVATVVKLGRVMLLAPMYAVAAHRGELAASRRSPIVPWFVIGFALAVALRSSGALPHPLLSLTDAGTTFLLAAGMFGLGMGIRLKELWPVPFAAFLLAAVSTSVAAGTSLVLILTLT